MKALSEALGRPIYAEPTKRLNKRERLEKKLETLEQRQRERIRKGLTRGAGAGGFNRDVDNIVHQIRLLKADIEGLEF